MIKMLKHFAVLTLVSLTFGAAPALASHVTCISGDLTPVIWTGTSASETENGCDGPDTLIGDSGNDTLSGGKGDDSIDGQAGNDVLYGDEGSDILRGGADNDTLNGGADDDGLFGGPGVDILNGDAGNDLVRGDGGDDTLNGGPGNDYVQGMAGNDILNGDIDDDILRGGAGVDQYFGGPGIDRVSFYDFGATQGADVDLVTQSIANDGFGNAETMSSIEELGAGTIFADVYRGDAGDNRIFGVGKGDIARGRGGDDMFQIDDAPKRVHGGSGTDCICWFTRSRLVDNSGTITVQNSTGGVAVNLATGRIANDSFGGSTPKRCIRNIENLGGSPGNDVLTGSGKGNVIWGYDGNDVINGRGGADTIIGGPGADTLAGNAKADTFVYENINDSPPGAPDTIVKFKKVQGDKIKLSDIQPLSFVAAQNTGVVANSVTWYKDLVNNLTVIQIDTTGDTAAEMKIILDKKVTLTAAQFVL